MRAQVGKRKRLLFLWVFAWPLPTQCASRPHCDAPHTCIRLCRARTWLLQHLHFDLPGTVSFFEATIRVVGGLVSASQLSGDAALGALGAGLAGRLLPAFTWAPTGALTCSGGQRRLAMEFADLEQLSGCSRTETGICSITGSFALPHCILRYRPDQQLGGAALGGARRRQRLHAARRNGDQHSGACLHCATAKSMPVQQQ